ncbi:MAG TPA: bifunctional glutamate N-acetyltransferase/amino-acid acetyltransferase ArgJ [Kiritimatiellia bacterium]|nr:bifunctional glutamate N-acetyltransferase/amino-acid acetyltransferase ArgJ [Kiritimatiellia bacterium]HMP00511.1 bifunctional glutamate N-acetyltransferase/amino-acid acetyltransferase ArgJ [Kiritimatiellia bacterium]HMP97617.1 bifunctional glutamate N-acetyltransferase/amino-acid acetyltransferase ArgJ [Kiritimatiellia bacterium]
MKTITIENAIVLPKGFRAAGVHAGIKKSGDPDMTMIVSELPDTAAAGTFTTNQVKAAPVKVCLKRIRSGKGRGVVINSGNANACTGKGGEADAEAMARAAARAAGVPVSSMYVCSTGHIGARLPMDKILAGIETLGAALSPDGAMNAVRGIMTTDNGPKFGTVRLKIDGKPVTLSVMCKGAGMIEPNMATMLCFVMTDAAVDRKALAAALKAAVKESFNRISVDGDMSTNDTVLLFANGAAGNKPLKPGHPDWKKFDAALLALCQRMAWMIIRDGEGAKKVIKVEVVGARSGKDAELAARSVANSLLVKTSWHNDYPNFGRIMDALGYSPAKIVENKVDMAYDGKLLVKGGLRTGIDVEAIKAVQRQELFTIRINLNLGKGASHVFSCDCAHAYIDINI